MISISGLRVHKMLYIIYSVFYNSHLNKNKELPIFLK